MEHLHCALVKAESLHHHDVESFPIYWAKNRCRYVLLCLDVVILESRHIRIAYCSYQSSENTVQDSVRAPRDIDEEWRSVPGFLIVFGRFVSDASNIIT